MLSANVINITTTVQIQQALCNKYIGGYKGHTEMKSSIARCDSEITKTFNEWLSNNKDKYTNSRLILQGATHLISVQMWVDFMDWLYSDSKNFKNTKKG